ncbi:unnamed protein product [Schistosoma margrebowiei]|uniref:Uncharacterized protein n=1 Tax=Schistosoma margrebowiei TaxID=48269 RepID=A0A183MEA7_9TREM|nr:unnamed protein product [Schistosoma margrebowiei]
MLSLVGRSVKTLKTSLAAASSLTSLTNTSRPPLSLLGILAAKRITRKFLSTLADEKHQRRLSTFSRLSDNKRKFEKYSETIADDLAVLSHAQQQMKEKTISVATASAAVGLNINQGKSKILRCNTACNNQITLDGEDLEGAETVTYVGSIIDEHEGSDARALYLQLKNIWDTK